MFKVAAGIECELTFHDGPAAILTSKKSFFISKEAVLFSVSDFDNTPIAEVVYITPDPFLDEHLKKIRTLAIRKGRLEYVG